MPPKLVRGPQGGNTEPPAKKVTIQSKNWTFTLFHDEPPGFNSTTMAYLAYGRETCPTTERVHWQGFVVFHTRMASVKNVQLALHPTIKMHVEAMRGNLEQNETYCSKEGSYTTFGTKPHPGARTDLAAAVGAIMDGKSADDFVIEDPMLYDRANRTLIRAEQLRMAREYRTEMTKGIWIYGPTGTGKSHWAFTFSGYPMDQIYVHQDMEKNWWDFYRQQPCVVFNDFRGQLPYSTILQLVDKWPYTVNRRYVGPIPFTSRLLIITSPMRPQDVYKGVLERDDSIDQLLRRFDVYHIDDIRLQLART